MHRSWGPSYTLHKPQKQKKNENEPKETNTKTLTGSFALDSDGDGGNFSRSLCGIFNSFKFFLIFSRPRRRLSIFTSGLFLRFSKVYVYKSFKKSACARLSRLSPTWDPHWQCSTTALRYATRIWSGRVGRRCIGTETGIGTRSGCGCGFGLRIGTGQRPGQVCVLITRNVVGAVADHPSARSCLAKGLQFEAHQMQRANALAPKNRI